MRESKFYQRQQEKIARETTIENTLALLADMLRSVSDLQKLKQLHLAAARVQSIEAFAQMLHEWQVCSCKTKKMLWIKTLASLHRTLHCYFSQYSGRSLQMREGISNRISAEHRTPSPLEFSLAAETVYRNPL